MSDELHERIGRRKEARKRSKDLRFAHNSLEDYSARARARVLQCVRAFIGDVVGVGTVLWIIRGAEIRVPITPAGEGRQSKPIVKRISADIGQYDRARDSRTRI